MKFLLAILFASGCHYALAQESAAPGAKCMPFNDIYKKLEDNGFAPVFLGEKNNTVELAVLKNKAGNWMLLKFLKHDDVIIACLVTEGDTGVNLSEEHPARTEGL